MELSCRKNSINLIKKTLNSVVLPKTLKSDSVITTTQADIAATQLYFTEKDEKSLQNVKHAPDPTVNLPNSEIISSKKHGYLTWCKNLSNEAKQVHIFLRLTRKFAYLLRPVMR